MSTQSQISEALNWRYATKTFDSTKQIANTDWKVLEESLRLAPSSYGLQPWRFLLVQNKNIRKDLRAVTWGQSQVEDCSHYVVITTLKNLEKGYIEKYIQQIANTRGVSADSLSGYKEMMIGNLLNGPRNATIKYWAQRQSYIAMGFLLETAALLKIDACPIEGLEPENYDKILGLENSAYGALAAVALGYRHVDDKYQNNKKVRFNNEDIIQFV